MKCCYCNGEHEDNPCEKRKQDALRFEAIGAQMYPCRNKSIESWPNLRHQNRNTLATLCNEVGAPNDLWLSERACWAINYLLDKLK